jgi:phosphate transport system permease protein
MLFSLFLIVVAVSAAAYFASWRRALSLSVDQGRILHSRPQHHGLYSAFWVLIIGWGALFGLSVLGDIVIHRTLIGRISDALPGEEPLQWNLVLSDARSLAGGTVATSTDLLRQEIAAAFGWMNATRLWVMAVATIGGAGAAAWLTYTRVSPQRRARNRVETLITRVLAVMATIAVLTTIGIVLSLIFETLRFFNEIDWQLHKYLFGTTWSPLSGVFEGEMDADKVGIVPLFAGTLMITIIAMFVAVPVGLFAAIYLSDFANQRVRSVVKPVMELLAGIPTVVYGFFAAITVAPFLRDTGEAIGIRVASESALAAGVVMGIMIIPFISSLSDDVISSVPQSLRDGSLGLGATKAETIRQVVLPAALPGIVSAIVLGVSKAIGETMIVVMAAGQGPNLTANPLEAMTTVTVQIVALITGDTEAKTAAGPAFTLGFTLFVMTLLMNMLAQRLVARFREAYD